MFIWLVTTSKKMLHVMESTSQREGRSFLQMSWERKDGFKLWEFCSKIMGETGKKETQKRLEVKRPPWNGGGETRKEDGIAGRLEHSLVEEQDCQ